MVDVDDILRTAIEKDASDVHLISGIRPMLRIARHLTPYEGCDNLTPEDMADIYDYFIRGNIDKDAVFTQTKKLDSSFEYNGLRKTNSGKTTTLNALINEINETQNKKILTLESPVEFKHKCKQSVIVQKEVGYGQDVLTYKDGVKNCLREDCDILVIGEIRDRETMDAAIETAEAGHLVIGTLHTKSCAETIDRMINFYEISDQQSIKYMIASLLKLVTSQRLIRGKDGKLVLVPEVMVVDNIISGIIRKEKLSVSEIEDAIQSGSANGSIGLINSIAELFVDDRITLDQAKAQIEEKNIEILNRTIMQLKIKRGNNGNHIGY